MGEIKFYRFMSCAKVNGVAAVERGVFCPASLQACKSAIQMLESASYLKAKKKEKRRDGLFQSPMLAPSKRNAIRALLPCPSSLLSPSTIILVRVQNEGVKY